MDKSDFVKCGQLFGYPECCIANFLERMEIFFKNPKDPSIRVSRKLHGTGYVPCPLCNATKSKEELIETINKNRKHTKLFPHE